MTTGIKIYIENLRQAAKPHFSPDGGIYFGKEGALRLAREIGYGLRAYDQKEVSDEIGSLYGKMIVENCLTRFGVPVSSKEFVDELLKEKGVNKMHIPTIEETFEHNLKQAVIRMIRDDIQFEGMSTSDAIYHLELSGDSLEDYIETNPKYFGLAMLGVALDYLGGDSLAELVGGDEYVKAIK